MFDVHSRRHPHEASKYDIPLPLRMRILFLYRDIAEDDGQVGIREFLLQMHRSLEYLLGRSHLTNKFPHDPVDDVWYFLQICETKEFFDFLELSFKLEVSWRILSNDTVDAINELLKIDDAPYRITRIVEISEEVEGPYGRTHHTLRVTSHPKVIRVDEEMTYREAVQPALSALSAPHFSAANSELLEAMEDYRKGDYGDSLTKSCSALESVMKVICERKGWPYSESDTASRLLDTVIGRSTLDVFFVQPILLIATIRNRLSTSHGGGTNVRSVDAHVAQFSITSTAAAIVLLVRETER
ncbi:MAG: hypothetical protein OXG64_05865 [Chloroflexi bacterium]|nr:hypothetical protein [Chloroflexota bacterium]